MFVIFFSFFNIPYIFNMLFVLVFSFLMFVFYFVYSAFLCCCCIVLCNVSPFVYSCLFTIFLPVNRPLPQDGNQTAVNKYHISYHISCHIISYHISCHIYRIVSYIISDRAGQESSFIIEL